MDVSIGTWSWRCQVLKGEGKYGTVAKVGLFEFTWVGFPLGFSRGFPLIVVFCTSGVLNLKRFQIF